MKIMINERIGFKNSRGNAQNCVHCGIRMGINTIGVCLTNKGDNLTIHKNLWLHTSCIDNFSKMLKKGYKNNKEQILAESI